MTAISLKTSPARNVSFNNVSVWGAVFNPQVFIYQRQDFKVANIEAVDGNPGFINVTTPSFDLDPVKSLNTYFRIKTPAYDFYQPALAITVVPPGPSILGWSIITFIAPGHNETEGDVGGFGNSDIYRPSFKAKSTVTINGNEFVYRHSGDNAGDIRADLSSSLKQFVVSKDDFLYNVLNKIDNNLFVQYNVQYTYEYKNSLGVVQVGPPFNAGNYFVTMAANQLGDVLGSNMGAYVPFMDEPNINKKAKFLTPFKEPVFNVGYPFDLQFIYSEKIQGAIMGVNFRPLDLNRNELTDGIINQDLLASLEDTLNASALEQFLASSTPPNNYALTQGIGVSRLTIPDVFSPETKYVEIYIYYRDEHGVDIHVTETKTIKVERSFVCEDKATYIKWLNILGGWDYWLFTYDSDSGVEITNRTYYDTQILDVATQDASEEVLNTEARDTIGLSLVDMPKAVLRCISALTYSPKVYYLTSRDPLKWLTVSVDSRTRTLYNSNDPFGSFDSAIKLPNIITQFN